MLGLASTSAQVATTTYTWLYVVLGVLSIIGTGGLVAVVKYLKASGARDSKIDALIDPVTGVSAAVNGLSTRVATLERTMRPNGLDTNQIGDIAKRTELAVDGLRRAFDRHLGESEQIHRELRQDIDRKQDRRTR